MTLETIAIDELQAHPRNYRGHPAEQIAHLKASLAEYGIVKNIVVASDNVILAGHGLVQAAREAGYNELPVCRIAMPSSDPKAQKFLIVDNEISRLSHDDNSQLAALLKELQDSQDLTGTGYDSDEVTQLLNDLQAEEFGATLNEDAGPEEPPIEPVTRLGDIWVMGEHRLVCGDCTEVGAWDVLFTNETKAKMVWTDPPYGVDYGYITRYYTNDNRGEIKNDALDKYSITELWVDALNCAAVFATGDLYCCITPGPLLRDMDNALDTTPWERHQWLVWVKNSLVLGNSNYQGRHEQIWYGWKKKSKSSWSSDRKQDSIFEYDKPSRSEDHPTMKPVELVADMVSNSSRQGDIVADPFIGSGTTLIACEQLNRICYGIELEPRYVDVAVKRWQKLTGKQAILESTGEAFSGE